MSIVEVLIVISLVILFANLVVFATRLNGQAREISNSLGSLNRQAAEL